MTGKTLESPEVQPRCRWTIGRVATDLGIIMVVVPSALDFLDPHHRGGCVMEEWFILFWLGIAILGIRPTWFVLKALNDAGEQWLHLPNSPVARRKPQPLDDF
jgi:hypothetical protein